MRTLVVVAVAWSAGIAVDDWLWGAPVVWVAGVALAVLVARRRPIAIILVALLGGALASALERARVLPDPAEGERVMEGVVVRPVEPLPDGRRVLVEVDRVIEGAGLPRARVLVSEAPSESPLLPGDRVRFAGAPRTPRGFQVEGAFDRARFLRGRGIDLVVSARPPGVVAAETSPPPSVWRAAAALQRSAAEAVARHAGEGAPLVSALVLGRREGLTPQTEESFRRAGVSHVLSVSGLHLAAVALLVFGLVRLLWLRLPLGLVLRVPADRAAALVAAPVAAGYTLLTGAEVATVRALLCVLVVLGGRAAGRRPDALTAVAAAALAILASSPSALFEVSFQLSFTAAITLALVARGEPAPQASWLRRALRGLRRAFLASLAVTLTTAPLTALHFGTVQPAGVLANLVVVPLAELVLLPAGLVALLVHSISPTLGAPLLAVAGLVSQALSWLVERLASVSPSLEVFPPRPHELLLLGIGALLLHYRRRLYGGLVLAAALGSLALSLLPPSRSGLTITFLDVGQGDAAVVETAHETWLIDAGGQLFGAGNGADPGEQAVWAFLRARRIRHLDLVILSHPHPDHIGGLPAVAGHVTVGEVWVSGDEGDEAIRRLLPVRVPAVGAVERDGVRLEVLAGGGDPSHTVNDNSLVVLVEKSGRRVLFSGDVEAAGELSLLAPRVDVVKVPHHGSRTSSTDRLVTATRPSVAVVSCGRANRWGFPAPEVVRRWTDAGAHVFRTDRDGSVTVRIDEDGRLTATGFRSW
jgi:competence protein ComEC